MGVDEVYGVDHTMFEVDWVVHYGNSNNDGLLTYKLLFIC